MIVADRPHFREVYGERFAPPPFKCRSFYSAIIWKKLDDGSFVVTQTPIDRQAPASVAVKRDTATMKTFGVYRCLPNGAGETDVELYFKIDFGGAELPGFVTSALMVEATSSRITRMQKYFQLNKPYREFTSKDALALSEEFTIPVPGESTNKAGRKIEFRVQDISEKSGFLKELFELQPWFKDLLVAFIENKLRAPGKVRTKAYRNLSKYEGGILGAALTSNLLSTTEVALGMEEWLASYPAMREFDKDYDWFRPLIGGIAKRLMLQNSLGLKLRVWLGALLSVTDLATDINSIRILMDSGKTGFAIANSGFLILAVVLQILLAYAHTRRAGWKKFAYEAVLILTATKPAVDAFRLAHGSTLGVADEDRARTAFDTLNEIMYMKCIEIGVESIPSGVLQCYAYIESEKKPISMLISICVSALVTGFASTVMSIDSDISPAKKKMAPDFHGYIPDDQVRRPVVFIAMFFMSFTHVLLKLISTAMFASLSRSYLGIYFAVDLSLYMLYKYLTNDLRFFIDVRGAFGFFVFTPAARCITKVLADFTALVRHAEHPSAPYFLAAPACPRYHLLVRTFPPPTTNPSVVPAVIFHFVCLSLQLLFLVPLTPNPFHPHPHPLPLPDSLQTRVRHRGFDLDSEPTMESDDGFRCGVPLPEIQRGGS